MAVHPLNEPKPGSECIHCGFCLETCPTYVLTGREEESPRGRILLAHALRDHRAPVDTATMAPLDHCLGCLACETACPSGVRYRDILFAARDQADQAGHVRHPLERFLLQHVITHPARLRVLVFFYRVLGVRSMLRKTAAWLPESLRERALLSPSVESAPSARVSMAVAPADAPKAILIRGCAARVFMPATEDAMAHLLAAAGYRVERRDDPRCCGALPHHAGMHALTQTLARETVDALGNQNAILVATAAGCTAHLRDLASVVSLDQATLARELGSSVRDLSQALLEAPKPLAFNTRTERVVFQDPCHLRHAQGILEEPRRLLQQTGAHLVEADEAELCCGSAGSYHLATPEISAPLARKKRAALLATGADTVVTANPGCWMQLSAVWPPDGPRLTTLARFLVERLAKSGTLPSPGRVHDHSSSSNTGTSAP
jgi:glycolate dehydrogenase iron-sulfur subunit